MDENKVNIIMQIYNDVESAIKCIESIIKNTIQEEYNLILINNNINNVILFDFLKELMSKNYTNIFMINNDKSLGFNDCVKEALMYDMNTSKNNFLFYKLKKILVDKDFNYKKEANDIVLLDSNVNVTNNWLRKIKRTAYSKENIATVTPLTNCEYILKNREVCNILNNDEMVISSDIIETTSLKMYLEIPSTAQFCIYIKREVIDKIGIFNSKYFNDKHGETIDFCCRAKESGYINVLCDDTFIYYKNSFEFFKEYDEYIENNKQLLDKIYPFYNKLRSNIIRENKIKLIYDNIKLQMKLRNGKRNILFISHNDIIGRDGFIGGSELNTKDLIDNIKSVNSYCLYTDKDLMYLKTFVNKEIIVFKFKLDKKIKILDFNDSIYKKYLTDIITYFNIDCIHVKHFIGNTFDVVDIAKENNIPLYLTLHDYYLICPKYKLIDHNNQNCDESRCEETCNMCLGKIGFPNGTITLWNKKVYEYLKQFDKIFAPSKSVVDTFSIYYKTLYNEFDVNIEIIEHGIPSIHTNRNERDSKNFKVAFIGSIVHHKGSNLIYDMIVYNNNNKIEWNIFGVIGDKKLNSLDDKYFINHGKYNRDEIQDLLIKNNIDLVCILSLCPETYCHTLSEAITSRIPVVVTDLGALKERVEKYNCGWIISHKCTAQDILEAINSIIMNKKDYIDKLENIDKLKIISKQDVYKIYEKRYLDVKKKALLTNKCLNIFMIESMCGDSFNNK